MLVDVAARLGSGSDTVRPVQPPSPAASAMATMSMPGGPARNLVCMRGIEGVGSHEYEQLGRLSAARPIRVSELSQIRSGLSRARGRWHPVCGSGAPREYKRRDAAHPPPAPVG